MTSGLTGTAECTILVLLEMGLSFFGIVSNLLIVTTLRNEETLRASTLNFLLFNLCFSNLVISFLVKPISAIYIGYAVSTGEAQVGLAFCTLYTFTYRTTWCVFPFTLIAMCWSKLLSQCMCGRCGVLCCKKRKTLAKLTKFQTIETPMPVMPETCPQPVTELLQIRTNRSLTTAQNSLQRDSSVSTPTPSTTPEINNLQPINESGTGNEHQEMLPSSSTRVAPIRTLEDGPTTRQKILVVSIWIFASIFGFLTCFPDKLGGDSSAVVQSGSDLPVRLKSTLAPSASSVFLESTPSNGETIEQQATIIEASQESPVESQPVELSYCSVKNGVNDMLDYIALVVALVAPLIIGPCIVGVFQGIFAVFGRFVCSRGTSGGPEASSEEKGPGWLIIIAFTAIFLGTYPLHMYFAELYLQNDFTFLLAKYCVGFLYVVLIPFITLVAQREIRKGVVSILLRDNTQANSGSCNALDDLPN